MNKTKIFYLISSLQIGGTENMLVTLANNLGPKKYELTICTIKNDMALSSSLKKDIKVMTLNTKKKYDILAFFRLMLILRKHKPDIIQSFLFFDNLMARICGRLAGIKQIISGRRGVDKDKTLMRTLLERFTSPLDNLLVTNSEAARRILIHKEKIDPNKIKVIYNGKDYGVYLKKHDTQYLTDELGLDKSNIIIGSIGRISEAKGHKFLLAAFEKIMDAHPGAKLLIVGSGELIYEMTSLARNLNISQNVYFMGWRKDIPQLLQRMDIFVMPSLWEGMPGAVLEAMASSVPVIATAVDGNKELITHNLTGLLVPSKSPKSIYLAIDKLIKNPGLRKQIGEKGKEYVLDAFSLGKMLNAYDKIYQGGGLN